MLESGGGAFRGAGQAAEEEDGETVSGGERAKLLHEVAAGDALGNGLAEDAACEQDGDSVGDAEVGGSKSGAELRQALRGGDDVRVWSHDEQRAETIGAELRGDPCEGFAHVEAIDRDTRDVEAGGPLDGCSGVYVQRHWRLLQKASGGSPLLSSRGVNSSRRRRMR